MVCNLVQNIVAFVQQKSLKILFLMSPMLLLPISVSIQWLWWWRRWQWWQQH